MRLQGKVALIPGGTSGIGEQIALGFVREGATVVVASRGKERVDKMAETFKELGHDGMSLRVDITKSDQVDKLVEMVVNKYGKLDIMLNSAGFFPAMPCISITDNDWSSAIDINLTGPFYCARAAARQMLKQKDGRIIFITSGQALRGVALMAHYSAAKGGLVALARAMASELGSSGITVNTIACGLTTTDAVNKTMPPQLLEVVANFSPMKRLARPDEYVGTAILLASNDGSFITGQTIAVDGGYTTVDAPIPMG